MPVLTVSITYTVDPTLKLRKNDLRRLIIERTGDRLARMGRCGQQPSLSVSNITIFESYTIRADSIVELDF